MMKMKPRTARKIAPQDILLPPGYNIDAVASGLTTPINIIFVNGQMFVADSGVATGSGKVLRGTSTGFEVIAEGFNPPLTGINYYRGLIYVSHRGYITALSLNGDKTDIIAGLPSWGDHHNNRVVFGPDGKMYFGQGTATNSGVVGPDNHWVTDYPFFHDYPGSPIILRGINYNSPNFLTNFPGDLAFTGAYSPYGVPTFPGEIIKGLIRASGSILRANPDGSCLELVAWGLRNPFRMRFDRENRLFSTNHGMDIRGSRPVANSPDEFYAINKGCWYGWPDYTGGMPVTLPIFKPDGGTQPEFILARHPMTPPPPMATFEPHSAIMGFDFSYNSKFPSFGDIYIAEFGSEAPRTTGGKPLPGVGHRVSRINRFTGNIHTFAINKSGLPASLTSGGGLERPIDVIFGPDENMYIADFGMRDEQAGHGYIPGTGIIWRVRLT